MKHIERMEAELKELKEKIEKAKNFLESEYLEPKFTDELQRQALAVQICYMKDYADVLKERIEYDKKIGGTND
ncbi:crAss001_48 related protein [Fusobacterium ulcerans]|uniref:crAss001_48 related protein n=1 Tax=Fusobacterium ulcerans TaxID=861 RepID=UPI003FEFD031